MKSNGSWPGIISRYKDYLTLKDNSPCLTLREGGTPLLPLEKLAGIIGLKGELYLKNEGLNPTGSYKDRGVSVAISRGLEEGTQGVICASLGNTGASAAAYAAKAGLPCVVLVPEEMAITGNTIQTQAFQATVVAVRGNYDDCLRIAQEIGERYPYTLVNSLNPYCLEGHKTAAFEIFDELKQVPNYVALPVGEGGNMTAMWQGFKDYAQIGRISGRLPKMLGFQGAGADPLVQGESLPKPKTIATSIQIGKPANWQGAMDAMDESGGLVDNVSDGEILHAYQLLAAVEGIFCEPAGAVALAGVIKLAKNNHFRTQDLIVVIATGNGLKDIHRIKSINQPPELVSADTTQVEKVLANWRKG